MDFDRVAGMELYIDNMERELDKVVKQRDELAEVLREVVDLCLEPIRLGENEKAIYDNAVHILGKINQSKGE